MQEITRVQSLESYFIYHAERDDYLGVYHRAHHYTYRENYKNQMVQVLKDNEIQARLTGHKWMTQSFEDQSYLVYILKSGNLYMGAVINTEELQKPLASIDLGPTGIAVYATREGETITLIDDQETMDWRQMVFDYFATGRLDQYVVLTEPSFVSDIYLVAMIPDEIILENLPYLQKINIWI